MELKIDNLSKTYINGTKALVDINLSITSGMFGLLGPNGAGKSTLMRTIATLQEPDKGKISFNGVDVLKEKEEVRKMLGFLPQEFGVYPEITAERMLDYIAQLKGLSGRRGRKETVKYILDLTNLFQIRKMKLGAFSGGMKQRFGIAQALIGNPKLLIVDEPTAGLDPEERNRFYNLLSDVSEDTIVILSTHIVDDVKVLCDQMAIINNGNLLYTGEPLAAVKKLKGKIWEKLIEKSEIDEYRKKFRVVYHRLTGGKMTIHVNNEHRPDASFREAQPDLEDVYFSVIRTSDN